MSHFDYQQSRQIEAQGYTFYALIMAAMRQADTDNLSYLKHGWYGVWQELQLRYNAADGVLPSDDILRNIVVTQGRSIENIEVLELSIDPDVFTFAEGIDNRITKVEQPHYTCPVCKMVSFNPTDLEAKYCGNCDKFESER